jgi:hypothetical protein
MESTNFKLLLEKSDEFGSIARKVNESSIQRKAHTELAIKHLNKFLATGNTILSQIQKLAKANLQFRGQNNLGLNTLHVLKNNLEKQSAFLENLKGLSLKINELGVMSKSLSDTIIHGIKLVESIISDMNRIILMDSLVLSLKKNQIERIKKLSVRAITILKDAGKAIEGSKANFIRGENLSKAFKKAEALARQKNTKQIALLVKEAENGWKTAATVNKSSISQWQFADQVNSDVMKLHEDTAHIKNNVIEKHEIFKGMLPAVSELAVLLAAEIQQYLEAAEILKNIKDTEIPEASLKNFYGLKSFVFIACDDVNRLGHMNFDMADSINLNAIVEQDTVKLSDEEIKSCDGLKIEVEETTVATRYPVEGSAKNIQNGKMLEKTAKELLQNIKHKKIH